MLRDPIQVEFYFNDGRKNVDIIKRQVSLLIIILLDAYIRYVYLQ